MAVRRQWKYFWKVGALSLFFVFGLLGEERADVGSIAPSSPLDGDDSESSNASGPSVGPKQARSFLEEIGGSEWGVDYQVKVVGESPKARVFFKSFTEELHEDFRWAIFKYRPGEKQPDRNDWAIPIRIELWGDVSDVFRDRDARMGVEVRPDGRFHLWIAARLHDEFIEDAFRLELIRAFVVEQMLAPFTERPSNFPGEDLRPPQWIVHGFDALIEHKRKGRPSTFFAGVIKSGRLLKPEQLFGVEAPESLDPIDDRINR
ncbi:MAG: hypothetical protein AAGC68_17560, partial [Verrucomicrobiota bacterium]